MPLKENPYTRQATYSRFEEGNKNGLGTTDYMQRRITEDLNAKEQARQRANLDPIGDALRGTQNSNDRNGGPRATNNPNTNDRNGGPRATNNPNTNDNRMVALNDGVTAPGVRPSGMRHLVAQTTETTPTAYSPTGSPAGAGGSTPSAPTVDTSATAPDPYQALIDQYAKSSGQTIEEATKAVNDIVAQLQGNLPSANGGRVDRVNTTEQENLLAQIVAAQQEQAKQRNDYAVQQGVDQLNRAMEDAAPQFQTMRNQAASAEAQALDNQALYAEARGDRGGIGAAQYASIQNTAAQNQLTVNREQTKLATDTARQIADLRAQGEFKKADELLSITQSYLSELMQLKQWADQTNISIDEFNIGVQQWEQEYNAKIQQALAGMKMDAAQWSAGQNLDNNRDVLNMTLSNMQQQESKQAKVAEQMIAAGITPTDQQLQAIGWNKDQYDAYKYAQQQAAAAASGGRSDSLDGIVKHLMAGNVKADIIRTYITNNTALYGEDAAKTATNTLNNSIKKYGYKGENDYDYGG